MQQYAMLIDGEWVTNDEHLEVIDPATEEPFATIPKADQAQIQKALEAAREAFSEWADLSPDQRADYLWRASAILEERKEKIGRLLTQEQGKPVKEAIGEIEKTVTMLQYYAEEGKRAYGKIIANTDPQDQSFVVKQPIGVVAALSPWNYPVELTGWKAAAGLAAGCTIVAKPPTLTPVSPLEFWRCLSEAGLPPGVINVVTGSGETAGRQIVNSPIPQKIAFTGSLEVGREVLGTGRRAIKRMSLELGGQCPMIISSNCDFDRAVKGAVRRSFRNMGQICIAINRIYVHDGIYEDFLVAFAQEAANLVIGNGLEKPDCDLGPMAPGRCAGYPAHPPQTPPCGFPAVGSSSMTPRADPGSGDPGTCQRMPSQEFCVFRPWKGLATRPPV